MNGVKAIKIMLPFPSSWFCNYGFSALTEIKGMKEGLLEIDNETRVCLAIMKPSFALSCSLKQAHPSHLSLQNKVFKVNLFFESG